jgi:autotransporter passenger strand-loop-strand repeat protein
MTEYIVSEQTSSGIVLNSGDTETVLNGGVADATVINSGGDAHVSSGGLASGTIVNNLSIEVIKVGGIAEDTTVSSGGTQYLGNGGLASGTMVSNGGLEFLNPGGLTEGVTVERGGYELVYGGATASNTDIQSGGTLIILPGGLTPGLNPESGSTVLSGGVIITNTVAITDAASTVQLVSAMSGTATSLTITGGEDEIAFNGGVISGSILSNGGSDSLLSGGVAQNTVIGSNGAEYIYSGGVASGAIVNSKGFQEVFSSGHAQDTTISSGGGQYIFSGGVASGSFVSNGGAEYVYSSGTASHTTVSAGGQFYISSGGLAVDTTVEGTAFGSGGTFLDATTIVYSSGTAISTTVSSGGLLVVSSGGTVSNTVLSSGGTLDVQSGGIVSGSVTFSGIDGMLRIDGTGLASDPSTLIAATISGFASGDTIDLTDITYSAAGRVNLIGGNELQIIEDGHTYDLQLDPLQNFTGDFFDLTDNGNGGTFVTEDTTPCYCRGTLILTERGRVAVEHLKIGDRLITFTGEALPIKWIGRRSYRDWLAVGNPDVQPIRFMAGSIADHVPSRDLFVSPEHAMLLERVLVPARHLVNGVSILKVEGMEEIDYFHFEFDRHVVIFAEGAAAESFVDDESRMLFHNADEYRRLYPNEPRGRYAEFCAPRIESGYALDTMRRWLMARAARLLPAGKAAPAPLRQGYLDRATREVVEGWAFAGLGEAPVRLAIVVNGAVVGQTVADRYRADLDAAGFGAGHCSFRFDLPPGLSPDVGHRIEVRRESDWTLLQAGCVALEPCESGHRVFSLSKG